MTRIIQIVVGLVIGFGAMRIARAYEVPLEVQIAALAAILFITVIGYPIGLLAGHFLSRGSDVDTNGFRAIGWANLVAWLIPIAGMVLSAVSYLFSRRSETGKTFYLAMSTIGALLAMGNSAWGGASSVYTQLDALGAGGKADTFVATTDRSWPRCQFAAIERWSDEDVGAYCRDHEPSAAEIREFERLANEHAAESRS